VIELRFHGAFFLSLPRIPRRYAQRHGGHDEQDQDCRHDYHTTAIARAKPAIGARTK
jgi:hypothetical protein